MKTSVFLSLILRINTWTAKFRMAVYVQSEIKVQATGQTVNVPNSPRAKLMYYLDCMCRVIDIDTREVELTNFANPWSLSSGQEQALIALCLSLDPRELQGKCIFLVNDGDPRLNGCSNEFYSIESSTTGVAATNSVILGGKTLRVRKIMMFTESWIDKNYITPMKHLITSQPRRETSRPAILSVSKAKSWSK